MHLQVRGPGWETAHASLPIAGGPVRATEFRRVVRGARLVLGIDALEAQRSETRGGTSNRVWRVLASGGCFLGEYVDNIEEFARHGVHALWYRHRADAVELARRALADPAWRARMASAGREHILSRHTYAHRLDAAARGAGLHLDVVRMLEGPPPGEAFHAERGEQHQPAGVPGSRREAGRHAGRGARRSSPP